MYALSVCREVEETYRVAALCSPVWQKRKRTSLRAFVNAYLLDIVAGAARRRCGRAAVGSIGGIRVDWRSLFAGGLARIEVDEMLTVRGGSGNLA